MDVIYVISITIITITQKYNVQRNTRKWYNNKAQDRKIQAILPCILRSCALLCVDGVITIQPIQCVQKH